jgi:NAD(P)-dependent dehydrogenase (short-subunit alcohol dehydrogenase family)
MELQGKVVLVSGGAHGIGRAMALRFAAAGARAVVVTDIDEAGASTVASEIESRCGGVLALALRSDVADGRQVVDAIERTHAAFGGVDLYCANAGVGVGTDVDTLDQDWDQAFAVNVRSHIAAARELIPSWVARGDGYFLSTASAAGLLSLVGGAPYTVTKHAAVAFAEWLAITYGERGVRVSCLCPMGVRTQLLSDGLDAPGEAGVGLRLTNAAGRILDPEEVAEAVVAGVRTERFLILPHPQVHDLVLGKASDHEAWLGGMRGLQARVTARAGSQLAA